MFCCTTTHPISYTCHTLASSHDEGILQLCVATIVPPPVVIMNSSVTASSASIVEDLTVDGLCKALRRVRYRNYVKAFDNEMKDLNGQRKKRVGKAAYNNSDEAVKYFNRHLCLELPNYAINMMDDDEAALMLHDLAHIPLDMVHDRLAADFAVKLVDPSSL